MAADGLSFLGVRVDASRNEGARGDADVSAPDAVVRTVVVEAREDLEIAAQVRAVLS
jgi:acetate kinase